ncbi:MAG TPA: hypothetical protein DHW82_00910 [Spirochaetia bacterium]|nr:MAG: hypothetical protein A2Y41_05545 [Spirochaetes bacterium GWB1_36_13]HCL55557.1 hypothetical protein [Spirochaetia bacterium]
MILSYKKFIPLFHFPAGKRLEDTGNGDFFIRGMMTLRFFSRRKLRQDEIIIIKLDHDQIKLFFPLLSIEPWVNFKTFPIEPQVLYLIFNLLPGKDLILAEE